MGAVIRAPTPDWSLSMRLVLLVLLAGLIALPAAEPVLALAGDSTVCDYPDGHAMTGWGQALRSYVRTGVTVANEAKGGRSTKTFRSEGRWDALLAKKPAVVLIQFGHNDSHAPDKPESVDVATDYPANLRRMVAEARTAGAVPVLVTPPPRRDFRRAVAEQDLARYVTAMRAVAAELEVPCIDLFAAASARLQALGDDGSRPFYCVDSDRTHFSARGAAAWARVVAEGLAGIPASAGLLRPSAEWPAPAP